MLDREELNRKLEAAQAEWEDLKDRLMQEDHLDEDGYPTEAALELIEEWHWTDCKGLLEFIKSIWHLASWGWTEVEANEIDKGADDYNEKGGKMLFISTAGWSGNESLIRAFQSNSMAWGLCWIQSRRGGHYIFKPHEFKDEGMTDEQLEAAARKLCELRGIDPERMVSISPPPNNMGYVPAVLLRVPSWHAALGEIRGFYQIARALDFVLGGDLP